VAGGTRAGNGYVALADQDSNHDGKITAADAHWKDIKVWVDANQDGLADASELHTLTDLSITELDLNAHSSTAMDHGNLLGLVSSYKTADGQSHEMADVWFSKQDAAASTAHSDQPATASTTPLPVALHELLAAPGPELLKGIPSSHDAGATSVANNTNTGTEPTAHIDATTHNSTMASPLAMELHQAALLQEDQNKNILL